MKYIRKAEWRLDDEQVTRGSSRARLDRALDDTLAELERLDLDLYVLRTLHELQQALGEHGVKRATESQGEPVRPRIGTNLLRIL